MKKRIFKIRLILKCYWDTLLSLFAIRYNAEWDDELNKLIDKNKFIFTNERVICFERKSDRIWVWNADPFFDYGTSFATADKDEGIYTHHQSGERWFFRPSIKTKLKLYKYVKSLK